MVTAIVRIKAEEIRSPDPADKIAEMKRVVETGAMIAFRACSSREPETGFELGLV